MSATEARADSNATSKFIFGAITVASGCLILIPLLSHDIVAATGREPFDFPWWINAIRAIMVFLGIILFVVLCYLKSQQAFRRNPRPSVVSDTINFDEARRELIDSVRGNDTSGTAISKEAAWDYAQRFLLPASTRARVAERIHLEHDHVVRTSTIEFQPETAFPRASGNLGKVRALRYVPVVRFNKGQLIENFVIRSPSGEDLPTLPYANYMRLSALCISTLLFACVDKHLLSQSIDVQRILVDLEEELVGYCIDSSVPDNFDLEVERGRLQNLVESRLRASTHKPLNLQTEDLQMLCAFVALARSSYAIVVMADMKISEAALFECSYTEPLVTKNESADSARLIARGARMTRSVLGLDPTTLNLNVSRAKKSASYHLRIDAPQGYYVGEFWFHDRSSGQAVAPVVPKNLFQASKGYYRCSPLRGRSYGHLYTRGFANRDDVSSPWLQVRFFERPPGSFGKAWLLAVTLFVISWLFGSSTGLSTKSGALGGVDPGALLFAVPLAVWALTGFGGRVRSYSSTATSQVSIVGSLLVSALCLFATLFIAGNRIPADAKWPSIVLVTHPVWQVLIGMSVVNLLAISAVLMTRYWRWRKLTTGGGISEEVETPRGGLQGLTSN